MKIMKELNSIMKKWQIGKIAMTGVFAVLSILFCRFAYAQAMSIEHSGIVEDLQRIEHTRIQGGQVSDDYFGYIKGNIPILISAPHGAIHYRAAGNYWKKSDAYTSSMAIELAHMTGAYVLYTKSRAPEDPNNQAHCRYKDMLARIVSENGIRFVLDLHGADENRPFKIDVGVMDIRQELSSCPTFMPIIEESFRDFDDHIFNKHFSAKGPGTVTYFARKTLGVESAQFEINALYRIPVTQTSPDNPVRSKNILTLLQKMKTMILLINERSTGKTASSSIAKLP